MITTKAYKAKKRDRLTTRCNNARAALAAYPPADEHDLRSTIVDLLCDLQHLATRERIDWESVCASARGHNRCEARPDDIEQTSILGELV